MSDEEDPFERAVSALDRVNRWMSTMFEGRRPTGTGEGQWEPSADVYETPDAMVVCVELAGVDPASIEVNFSQGQLVVSGYREVCRGSRRCHRAEIEHGRFSRCMTIPIDVDEDKIHATSRHGLLEICLPRRQEAAPRKISISDESEQPG